MVKKLYTSKDGSYLRIRIISNKINIMIDFMGFPYAYAEDTLYDNLQVLFFKTG